MIEENFGILNRAKEDLPEEVGSGEKEIVEFKGPLGRMKLERLVRPLVLGKKTIYSKRGGSKTTVDYVYSDSETTTALKAYRFDEALDYWQEIDANNFVNNT